MLFLFDVSWAVLKKVYMNDWFVYRDEKCGKYEAEINSKDIISILYTRSFSMHYGLWGGIFKAYYDGFILL